MERCHRLRGEIKPIPCIIINSLICKKQFHNFNMTFFNCLMKWGAGVLILYIDLDFVISKQEFSNL